MIKNLYYCDQCQEQVDKSDSLYTVRCEMQYPTHEQYKKFRTPSWYKSICEKCLAKLGIIRAAEVETEAIGVERQKSIEERLFDVISEIVQMNQPSNPN